MNLLVTGAWPNARKQLDTLRQLGHRVEFLQQEKEPLPCDYAWVEGVVCNGLFLHHPIEKFENLRCIQLTSAGFDRVPMDYVKAHGIRIHNAGGVYSIPMAEYALAGVLQIYKRMDFFRENHKHHRWEKHRGLSELAGRKVCILGCGSVGAECARRFSAFGCAVTGVATTGRAQPFFDAVLPLEDLDAALSGADALVLALPLTEATHHLIGIDRLRRLKPGAVLVNIARGAIVDTPAMEEALRSGHLRGAVLDVFEEEPLRPDSPLWDLDNVILTPHNSFVGENNETRLASVIAANISSWEEKHDAS